MIGRHGKRSPAVVHLRTGHRIPIRLIAQVARRAIADSARPDVRNLRPVAPLICAPALPAIRYARVTSRASS